MTSDRSSSRQDVGSAYDGSSAVYRLLTLSGWGPALLNLGYHRRIPIIGSIAAAQRRLVEKAVRLLDVRPLQQVLDIACGRGESSAMIAALHPDAYVAGVDLLAENVRHAMTSFAENPRLSFRVGDAMQLELGNESIDRIACIEAAFHFPDRARFLAESFRVLRPGGRLVVVDFAWETNAGHDRRNDAATRLVRKVWQWDDFFSIDDYHRAAGEAGLLLTAEHDWSARVTGGMQARFRLVSALGNSAAGRALLRILYPSYSGVTPAEWREIAQAAQAHEHVQQYSRYMVFVFDKP
ncbi:MAG: Phthiotriol/phenolphthiotriol dimycocerosates methyltransferase [Gemmatimonadetes bacterium]|nr:Phthiotriol/phenolphthiotriol dimycocerosates methyltransferase [Gemmatimonadota bacterium]